MAELRISDIPSIQKNLRDLQGFKTIKQVMPLLRPVLRLLKVDVNKINETFLQIDELEQMAQELATIPDKFNDCFAERGWIIYERMNLDVVKAAIKKAESGDIDEAEADLVEYYSGKNIEFMLLSMNTVAAFRPRMELARKALTDYKEGRYYACVLVVLSLLDGLVNDLHQPKQSFFSEGVNLEAWDSVAAHSKGLQVLNRILQKGRYKTTTESISIPYRNGIIHGIDLGYDNQMVAAKAWAALFATREWAIKAEKGLLSAPPEKPGPTWREVFQKIKENADDRELLAQWQPRKIEVGVDIPFTGEPGDYQLGTPEQRVAEYLFYWKKHNYGYMAKFLSGYEQDSAKKRAGRIKEQYAKRHLQSFEFLKIDDCAAAITEVETRLVYIEQENIVEKAVRFRLLLEDGSGHPVVRGKARGKWSILNWAV